MHNLAIVLEDVGACFEARILADEYEELFDIYEEALGEHPAWLIWLGIAIIPRFDLQLQEDLISYYGVDNIAEALTYFTGSPLASPEDLWHDFFLYLTIFDSFFDRQRFLLNVLPFKTIEKAINKYAKNLKK